MINSPHSPLKVALLSISPHNRAILEFFFAGAGKKVFTAVSTEEAEALVVDLDHPGAQQEWQSRRQEVPLPAIVLSVKESVLGNAVWVPKPLTSQALMQAAEQVRNMLPGVSLEETNADIATERRRSEQDMSSLRALLNAQHEDKQVFGISDSQKRNQQKAGATAYKTLGPVEADKPSVSIPNPPDTREQLFGTEDVYVPEPLSDDIVLPEAGGIDLGQLAASDVADTEALQQRWIQLCGDSEERLEAKNWQESTRLYTPENYLLNSLVDALTLSTQSRQYVQVVLEHSDFILLMPDVNLAYSSIDIYSDDFVHLCNAPLQGGRVKHHLPGTPELDELEEIVRQGAQQTYDMEGLIWTVSLLTSHGRLSRHADMSSLRLKSWPNLTRLEQFPHVMSIAALWSQRAGNVFDLSQWLDIPQRYILAFYSGAHTLGLFEVDQGRPEPVGKTAPKKNRGLFSRLLKRLLGGGSK